MNIWFIILLIITAPVWALAIVGTVIAVWSIVLWLVYEFLVWLVHKVLRG